MTDYVLSYDICAFIILLLFLIYYATRRRVHTLENRLYSIVVILAFTSVLFDICSAFGIIYPGIYPTWIEYFFTILYFVNMASLICMYCLYTIVNLKSSILESGKTWLITLLSMPYFLFVLLTLTTPFSKLVFYLESDGTYKQGPLMFSMLIIVVFYIMLSLICVSFYHGNVPFKKRFPYYAFVVFMIIAILFQHFYPQYLLYGIATAIGLVFVFIYNHNTFELIDYKSEMLNRRALGIRLNEIYRNKQNALIFATTIKEIMNSYDSGNTSLADAILFKFTEFLNQNYNSDNIYVLDDQIFILVLENNVSEKAHALDLLTQGFDRDFVYRSEQVQLNPGIVKLEIPKDCNSPARVVDMIETGALLSINGEKNIIDVTDIINENENMILKLENQQKILEQRYNETEDQRQKAVYADRSKTLFLAQMSHEIRTPMTAILGMTELLLRDSKDPKITDHARDIMNAGKLLLTIINDILDFSKIESGKIEIINEDYYITSTVYDVMNGIEAKVSEKRLSLSVDYDYTIPAVMYGDEVRIKQILNNLLSNACKYTENGGIMLRIGWSRDKDNCLLDLTVADTGVGIEPANLSKIFECFEKLESDKDKVTAGSGLGLTIIKQLVDAMNGTISVESEVGVGSTFRVVIPQHIVDDSNSVKVDDEDKLSMLVQYDNEREYDDYKRTFDGLHIKTTFVSSSLELDTCYAMGGFTHIFMSLNQYEKRKLDKAPVCRDSRLIVGLYYNQYMANIDGHRFIHMPICCINVAALLMGESVYSNVPEKNHQLKYIAPEADILVVDDNVVNLKIFEGLVENHRMSIDSTDSGFSCLEKTRIKKYDLIFLDHMMPKKDGIETLVEMKADPENMNLLTPVIAFSANAVSGMKERFADAGFSDFVSKPIDIAKLEEVLTTFLPREKIINVYEDPTDSHTVADTAALSQDTAEQQNDGKFSVKGLDMEKALYYSGESYDVLKSVLEVFESDGMTKKEKLPKYIEENDFESYRIDIHAIKSLCKGIGAEELSEKARLLEFACRDGDHEYVLNNHLEAETEFSELLQNISECLAGLKEQKTAKKTESSSVFAPREQLICISALLKEFEEDLAAKLLEDLDGREMDEELQNVVSEVKHKLSLFDYDGAAEIIDAM